MKKNIVAYYPYTCYKTKQQKDVRDKQQKARRKQSRKSYRMTIEECDSAKSNSSEKSFWKKNQSRPRNRKENKKQRRIKISNEEREEREEPLGINWDVTKDEIVDSYIKRNEYGPIQRPKCSNEKERYQ